jgi:hypothetical protein
MRVGEFSRVAGNQILHGKRRLDSAVHGCFGVRRWESGIHKRHKEHDKEDRHRHRHSDSDVQRAHERVLQLATGSPSISCPPPPPDPGSKTRPPLLITEFPCFLFYWLVILRFYSKLVLRSKARHMRGGFWRERACVNLVCKSKTYTPCINHIPPRRSRIPPIFRTAFKNRDVASLPLSREPASEPIFAQKPEKFQLGSPVRTRS